MTEIPPDLPPARRSEASTSKRAPVLMKQTIPSFSDRQLQHIAKLASGPVDGPFPCVTADPMREKKKKLPWRKACVPFPDLGSPKL